MSYKIIECKTKAEWLNGRKLSGTRAYSLLSNNARNTKQQVYRYIFNLEEEKDISEETIVKFGRMAEPHIRSLFGLMYPDYEITSPKTLDDDGCIEMYVNEEQPFMTATIDGMILDKELDRKGILEIKTATINSVASAKKWDNQVPIEYYAQILHYLLVMGDEFQFCVLVAMLKYPKKYDEEDVYVIKQYKFERSNLLKDLKILKDKENEFIAEYLEKRIEPPLTITLE